MHAGWQRCWSGVSQGGGQGPASLVQALKTERSQMNLLAWECVGDASRACLS